jgi:pullulanase
MKPKITFLLFAIITLQACQTEKINEMNFETYPIYNGIDLGLTYSSKQSMVKVYSPVVDSMRIHLYEKGHEGSPFETRQMTLDKNGVWSIALDGDWKGKYYTVQVFHEGKWLSEAVEPYAKATGANGIRAMFVNLAETNPEGWANDKRPTLSSPNDIIIYELHVRDVSIHESSGIKNKGKFLGLVEAGTKSPTGESTGLDHIKELGITHVHLLPSFDFMPRSVDEMNPNAKYNWGYDPQNYNVPEGSYSTNPYDGDVRIKEFKQMVKTFHDNGIRVILDVVYNHTGQTEDSYFNQIAPKYYYRLNEDGSFSNASACGNETASERPMVRKFMIESMKYWAEEYHLDGFRVDLMGIHDIETMNLLSDELEKIDSTIFVYGEGWNAGSSPLPAEKQALKRNTTQLNRVAAFSDDIRDGLKGSVFEKDSTGFVSGRGGLEETIKFGIIASTEHPQVDYSRVNYSKAFWANQPSQTMTYVSCHDNNTLFDKLEISRKDASEADRLKMHRLAGTIVLTSQGVSFMHAGMELARTKFGVENSYESPDSINQIVWERKTEYKDHFNFYKNLVHLRKNHPAFRMTTTAAIQKHLSFFPTQSLFVGYQISGNANGDAWKNIIVLFNGSNESKMVDIPEGNWTIVIEGDKIDENGIRKISNGSVEIPAIGTVILMN